MPSLIGFQLLDRHGYALPVYGQKRGSNDLQYAVCRPEGDPSGKIVEFRQLIIEHGEVHWLEDHAIVDREIGAAWIDVFVWNGSPYRGTPDEIWEEISPIIQEIAVQAPITAFRLAESRNHPDLRSYATAAKEYIRDQFGDSAAIHWINHEIKSRLSAYLSGRGFNPRDILAILANMSLAKGKSIRGVRLPGDVADTERTRIFSDIRRIARDLGLSSDVSSFDGTFDDSLPSLQGEAGDTPFEEPPAANSHRPLDIAQLIDRVRGYDPTVDEAILTRAHVYTVRVHGSGERVSSDPYFAHPIEVAGILTDYRLDTATIVTALLHDVLEDGVATAREIEDLFGPEVAGLVEGVTKITALELNSELTRQAEKLRQFILAISKDVRVLMVKLADRLHDMRTLQFIKVPAKRERIARETLDVYAPLARSIGCHRICSELEELAFKHLNPVARDAINRRLEALRHEQGGAVAVVSGEIAAKLQDAGISARVIGRQQDAYSIWRKLQRRSIGFSQLSDIYAFRVIVDTEEDCYRALSVIHRAWPSVPERFKDFISTPKRNNYRSLHTTVVGPKGMRILIQIRTEAMDRVAEEGVAAHWRYKDQSYGFDAEAQAAAGGRDPLVNLRHLVQVLEHGGDVEELVEHAKLEMYRDQTFVFTPKGKLVSLPRGAMPLDFAYAVHTDVGDTCIGVKINGEPKPLQTQLQNGDVVEVIRGPKPPMPADWQTLTVTRRARHFIRKQIREIEVEEYRRSGKGRLAKKFLELGKNLQSTSLRPALQRFSLSNEVELFEYIGSQKISPDEVVGAIFRDIDGGDIGGIYVDIKELIIEPGGQRCRCELINLAECCAPVYEERIVGIAHRSANLSVHALDCPGLVYFDDKIDAWRDLNWSKRPDVYTRSTTRLILSAENTPDAISDVTRIVSEAKGRLRGIQINRADEDVCYLVVSFDVMNLRHLHLVASALLTCPSVAAAERHYDPSLNRQL